MIKLSILSLGHFFFLNTLFGSVGFCQTQDKTSQTPLDPSIQIAQDQVPTIFKDIVVVQRKAKEKGGHFVFNPFGSFDFSDGPVTMYGMNTNIGYAISDFWEVYLNVVPTFLTQERSIVKKVREYQLDSSQCTGTPPCFAEIVYSKPKSQYGLEVLWMPAYGKDSWGPYSIVRSDTFFKLGVAQINYEAKSGMRYSLLLGKTYFISKALNFRFSAGMSSVESFVDSKKSATTVAIIESGLVFYF